MKVEWRTETRKEDIGGAEFTVISTIAYDPLTGRDMSDEEVSKLFMADELTGVSVIMKAKWLETGHGKEWPIGGTITAIREDAIELGERVGIPRTLFHEWYELD